ncbi:hypothetical protein ACFL20_08495 [Spirochaetota bacterium]
MKKFLGVLLLGVVVISVASCASLDLDPKKAACKEACKTALDECKKKAKGDKVKIAACEVANKKCLDECNK